MTQILFWVFAAVAIASALMVILHRNPVYSALSLVLTLFAVSGLYLLMGAYFVGAVQIVVYAGAIVVLFLFVIMLLNLGNQESLQETFSLRSFFGVIVGLAFVVIAGMTVTAAIGVGEIGSGEAFNDAGHTQGLARLLFTNYLLPFEITSVILTAGLVGVIALIRFHRVEKER